MNFASFPYLLFLAVIVFLFYRFSDKRKIIILLASYLFYSFFGVGFALLMFVTSWITYWASSKSYNSTSPKMRKFYFLLGLVIDLIIFVVFKYFHLIDIEMMNWPNFSAQDLLIPLGISFYTFKTLGYCIDIYQKKYSPIDSFSDYALSVSFFPQLIAGPIEKSKNLAVQFNRYENFNPQNIIDGGKLILWGMFKKIVIADSIAQIINPCFANLDEYQGFELWLILFGFVYQIYVDFSGYSDIAIGSAILFNIKLPANFNKPFYSKSVGEFWIRWHITFSRWLKEYVFDNIGGVVRGNKLRTVINLWILFQLVGIWHGATLNYMLYANLAFIWMLGDITTRKKRKKIFKKKKSFSPFLNYLTIILMMMSLCIFFRTSNLDESIYIVKNLFLFENYTLTFTKVYTVIGLILLFEFFQYFQISPKGTCVEKVKSFKIRALIYVFMIFCLVFLSMRADITFQYYQF